MSPVMALDSEISTPAADSRPERLDALRDVAKRLRTAPDATETLQHVLELCCRCTGSDAGMLTIASPENRQVVFGTALGAGPYISMPLRAGGPTLGEIVLTRMSDAPEFEPQDETFADLVAEYIAKALSGLRRGTVLSDEQQDFIDRVTEELRSPLAGAVNLIESVRTGHASPEEARSYLETAARDSRRMLNLIDDLLHIARLRPPEPREMEALPVGPWLRRAVEAARPAAEVAGHRLALSEPDGAYVVKAVPAQLDLVMRHLLDNAIKFSERPSTIEVSVVPVEGLLRIAVADQGIGFDNTEASRMLDCFARATNAEAARIPGAGVGLFLASEIVRGHGGRLWLESRRDEGTQAYLGLPYEA